MTDFANDLMWEEAKQPDLALPGRPHERQHADTPAMARVAPTPRQETMSERLQRVAGNSVLAREAEQATAVQHRLDTVARRPEAVPTSSASVKAAATKPKPALAATEKAARNPKAPVAEREKAAKHTVAAAAMATEARRLPEATKAAAIRSAALAQVLEAFERDAARADLLTLALLVEKAPADIAEQTARVVAQSVMRADPDQRAAIAVRVKTQIGDRQDLRLTRLLSDRLSGLLMPPAPARPPPPPPPPPPH